MTTIKYEKPSGVPLGAVAPIMGETCHEPGNDPDVIPYCGPGNIATGNCWPTGSTAGQTCFPGGTAALCAAGNSF